MHSSSSSDRRHASRYKIELPIEIRIGAAWVVGRTRDLNQQWIAVRAPVRLDAVTPGQRVGFVLLLEHLSPDGPTKLEGDAVVVRIEPDGAEAVLALKAEWLTTTPLVTAGAITCGPQ
jgi:hypothetical protein